MILDWQGALDSVIHHPLFGLGITLGSLKGLHVLDLFPGQGLLELELYLAYVNA